MFCGPQIFTRNHLESPVFSRTYDSMHSMVHLSSMVAISYSFPLSNYSISYCLAKKIGYWDTNTDAIGEDFHTCQKCHWKLDGPFHTIPIYVPFNQFSLSTGEGYCKDVRARFWQAERHTRGVTDVAYCFNMLFKTKFKFRNLILTLLVTEVFMIAATIPWALIGIGIQYKLVDDPDLQFVPQWVIDIALNSTGVMTLLSYVFYECFKRVSNRVIHQRENDRLWRVVEYPVFFLFALFGFSIPTFLISSFGVLCSKTDYNVAEKKINKQDPKQAAQSDRNLLVKGRADETPSSSSKGNK